MTRPAAMLASALLVVAVLAAAALIAFAGSPDDADPFVRESVVEGEAAIDAAEQLTGVRVPEGAVEVTARYTDWQDDVASLRFTTTRARARSG